MRGRPRGPSSNPRGSWATLGALCAIVIPAAFIDLSPRAARAEPLEIASTQSADGAAALAAAQRALESGHLADADATLRRAFLDSRTTDAASEKLWALHARADFQLPTDDAALKRTLDALGPIAPNFKQLETPHFIILSDADSPFTRERGRLLERARDQFYRVAASMKLSVAPHAARLLCVLFADVNAYRKFAHDQDALDATWIGGYFSASSNRIVFYNHVSAPETREGEESIQRFQQQLDRTRLAVHDAEVQGHHDRADKLRAALADQTKALRAYETKLAENARSISDTKTIHECIHLLSFNSGAQRTDREYPFWISEGLAMAFESERQGGLFGPDRPSTLINDRLERYDTLMNEGKLLPLTKLVGMTGVPNWDEAFADAMYAQSHALFLMLYKRDPVAVGAYMRVLRETPGRLGPGLQSQLFIKQFGSIAPVEASLRRLSMSRQTGRGDSNAASGPTTQANPEP
jgi:hypothetical protein